jgi:hypothetical protein
MLSDDVRDALERVRRWTNGITPVGQLREQLGGDFETLVDAMLNLFPVRTIGGLVIRWDDEITPERLVSCGGRIVQQATNSPSTLIDFGDILCAVFHSGEVSWLIEGAVIQQTGPRNMGKFFELMERCGIEVPK